MVTAPVVIRRAYRKLIEVTLPLDAINEASARERSIRHGHLSTLHHGPKKKKRPLRGVGLAMLSPAGSQGVTVNPCEPELNGKKGWAECSG